MSDTQNSSSFRGETPGPSQERRCRSGGGRTEGRRQGADRDFRDWIELKRIVTPWIVIKGQLYPY